MPRSQPSKPEISSPADLFRAGVRELEVGNVEAASTLFALAEDRFVSSHELYSAAVSALNYASALEDLGRFAEALEILKASGDRDSEEIDQELQAERDLLYGLLHEHLGNFPQAIESAKAAMKSFLDLGNEEQAVLASINLAGAYESAGQTKKALEVYREASVRAAALGMSQARDEILTRMAVLRDLE